MADFPLTEIALQIATRLTRNAVSTDRGPNWVVNVPDFSAPSGKPATRETLADAYLYQGTAGIGWFLLECAHVTNDPSVARMAREVITGACLAAANAPSPASFFSGGIGVAWVASRAFELTQDERFRDTTLRLVDESLRAIDHDSGIDIVSGAAGTAIAALNIAQRIVDPRLMTLAVRAGEHASRLANRRLAGWSWRSSGGSPRQDLCGYAHGVSGFVHAFLELFAATSDERWRFAAQRGLLYEHRHIVSPTGDWPDFRDHYLSDLLKKSDPTAQLRADIRDNVSTSTVAPPMRAWCHGAPGMLPVRRLAINNFVRLSWLGEEERVAAELTRQTVTVDSRMGFSLCHGVAGNAEELLLSPLPHSPSDIALVANVFAEGADRFERTASMWPSGVINRKQEPSLMVGDAGVGIAALRCEHPDIPSVLFPTVWSAGKANRDVNRHRLNALEELRSAMPLTVAAVDRITASSIGELIAGSEPETLVESLDILEACATDPAHAAHGVRQIFDIETARLRLEHEILDVTREMREEIAGASALALGVADICVAVPESLRLFQTDAEPDDEFVDALRAVEYNQHFAVYFRSGRCMLQAIKPIAALTLSAARTAQSVPSLVTAVAAQVEIDGVERATIEGAVRQTIHELAKIGLLREAWDR